MPCRRDPAPETGGDAMPTWVWIAHAASPDELQATVNAFLRALHAHGGEVVDIDY